MAQKFVVFPSDVTKEEIALWFSNNGEGVSGWWTGIPPFLQTRKRHLSHQLIVQ